MLQLTATITSTAGIDISFRFAIWGGSGANGMTFFLRRGSESDRGMGPTGGSLGYAADQYSPAKKGAQKPELLSLPGCPLVSGGFAQIIITREWLSR